MTIAYTGASGWIGRRLTAMAEHRGLPVSPVRARVDEPFELPPARTMIHLGGIAHDLDGRLGDDAYRRCNTELSLALARRCADAGYADFVFVSTAKVVGERTDGPIAEDRRCLPQGAYARSKHEAELALGRLAAQTAMRIRILRPPLVYGPGAGANFARLMAFADSPWPWPASSRPARRSLVFIDNLVDALLAVPGLTADEPGGTAAVYHVADGPAPSVEAVVDALRRRLGRPLRRIGIPAAVLDAVAGLPRIGAIAQRLFGSLELDISRLLATGWRAPVSFDAALDETVRAWRTAGPDGRRR